MGEVTATSVLEEQLHQVHTVSNHSRATHSMNVCTHSNVKGLILFMCKSLIFRKGGGQGVGVR